MKSIQEWRKIRRFTRRELASDVGVTIATVYNWERGKSEPKASQLRKIADALGITMNDIDVPEVVTPKEKTRRLNVSDDG